MDGIVFYDHYALWPTSQGPFELFADGSYHGPKGKGECRLGEWILIDPTYPLRAQYTEMGWRYEKRDAS